MGSVRLLLLLCLELLKCLEPLPQLRVLAALLCERSGRPLELFVALLELLFGRIKM